jgi:hypothetical protein
MTKPVTPKQVKNLLKPKNKRAHLKKLVARRINRELKKGLSLIKVPNCIDKSLAVEIAEEFRKEGWTVTITDCRIRVGRWRTHSQNGCNVAWKYEVKP